MAGYLILKLLPTAPSFLPTLMPNYCTELPPSILANYEYRICYTHLNTNYVLVKYLLLPLDTNHSSKILWYKKFSCENALGIHAHNHLQVLLQIITEFGFQKSNAWEQSLIFNQSENMDYDYFSELEELTKVSCQWIVVVQNTSNLCERIDIVGREHGRMGIGFHIGFE